jgi:hypothetical protein
MPACGAPHIIIGDKFVRIREDVDTKLGKQTFGDKLDCRSPADTHYPVVIDLNNDTRRKNAFRWIFEAFGIDLAAGVVDNLPKSLVKCPTLLDSVISKPVFEHYQAEGFSLTQLCMILDSGSIIFNPETGQRLPTYVELENGQITPEYLFVAPACFARGRTKLSGDEAWMSPIGCKVNYQPWSGRRLSSDEVEFFTREMKLLAGGAKGQDEADVENLVGGVSRRYLTSDKMEEIKKQAQASVKTETPVAAKDSSAGVADANVRSTPTAHASATNGMPGAKDLDKYKWGAVFVVMIACLLIVSFGRRFIRRKA